MHTMATDVVTVRLPPRDTEMIDFLVKQGEFKSRSDFLRFAAKRAVTELLEDKLREKVVRRTLAEEDLEDLERTIRTIRSQLWTERHG